MAAYTTIDDPSAYFECQLYTGTGSSNAVTFNDTDTDMQPDFVIIKDRDSGSNSHVTTDVVRGVNKILFTDSTSTALTDAARVSSYNSDGFTVGTDGSTNTNTNTYVAWCWKANGSGAANSEGNTTTTKTSANTTSGFSIITYDGDGAAATLGHGLGAVPHFIIQKNLSDTENWQVYHHKNTAAPETDYLTLNTNNATGDQSSRWNDTAPTSTLISIGSDSSVSQSGESMLMLAWSEKQGFSKFGKYTGNGNADGAYVHLGFRASLIILKRTGASDHWWIHDNKRGGYNGNNKVLYTNIANAESDSTSIDILSNGFKIRTTDSGYNPSGANMVYMAWADAPCVNSEGVPATAR